MDHHAATGTERTSRRPSDVLVDAFRPLTRGLFDEDDSFVVGLEGKLAEARIGQPIEVYLSRALAWATLFGILLGLLGIAAGFALFISGIVAVETIIGVQIPSETVSAILDVVRTPLLIVSGGLVLATIGFFGVFGVYIAIPYSRASRRGREIDALLPDAISFMYALSLGGMSQIELIETMAEAETTYGEVSLEFRSILQETRFSETDYRTAIRNRAANTPSSELSQFFTDMLSIIDSGGSMTDFLDDKKAVHFRHAREAQERKLDTLELFSEVYITISIFPLLLIVILVILEMIAGGQELLMYAVVYALLPGLGLAFLTIVATVREDEHGSGHLEVDHDGESYDLTPDSGALDLGLVEEFAGQSNLFDRIARQEGTSRAIGVLRRPHHFFRDHPLYTLAITVPAAAAFLLAAAYTGGVATTWSEVVADPVGSTVLWVYAPLFLICIPLAVFREWNVRRRYAILDGLSEDLRKLASANATGLTLLESIEVVAETTPGRIGAEFRTIHSKCNYGMSLRESMVVFNNKYTIPRLARTVTLINKASEISTQIPTVLSTAAKATETQEDIERDRKERALMQVAIILFTYLVLLGVIVVLQAQFVETIGEVVASGGASATTAGGTFGSTMDANVLTVLFFHAVTLQAICSGLVCGYVRSASLLAGVKYVALLLAITLGVWVMLA